MFAHLTNRGVFEATMASFHAAGRQAQGFRTIIATEPFHPYMSHWWPPGHIIGYEHGFVHAAADFLEAIAEKQIDRPKF